MAGTFPSEKIVRKNRPEYVLESFFYIKPWQVEEMPKWKMFLLDSGAFTFMHGVEASSKPVDWDGYLSRYIDFINRHDVQHFFELDVDIIVGYDAVKRMRARLEAETGKQSIPVWHRSRGLDEFKNLCRDYPYPENYTAYLGDYRKRYHTGKRLQGCCRCAHPGGCTA